MVVPGGGGAAAAPRVPRWLAEFESPVTFRVGQVMTGVGVGCGLGLGVGSPVNVGALPIVGPVVGQVIATFEGMHTSLGDSGRLFRSAAKRLGVQKLEMGIGCGVGIGHGFGVGLALKPGVGARIARTLQAGMAHLAEQLQARLETQGQVAKSSSPAPATAAQPIAAASDVDRVTTGISSPTALAEPAPHVAGKAVATPERTTLVRQQGRIDQLEDRFQRLESSWSIGGASQVLDDRLQQREERAAAARAAGSAANGSAGRNNFRLNSTIAGSLGTAAAKLLNDFCYLSKCRCQCQLCLHPATTSPL
eukprot:SM000249S08249  [mRNA]  locus=s249:101110:103125:- [translate_table: standard]